MKKYLNPNKKEWAKLTQRPLVEQKELFKLVHQIFAEIGLDPKFKSFKSLMFESFLISEIIADAMLGTITGKE